MPIVPPAGVRTTDDILYDLLTRGGSRIVWGHAPGSERPGDPRAADKLAVLRQYATKQGSLESPTGEPRTLDLRTGHALSTARRAAAPGDDPNR